MASTKNGKKTDQLEYEAWTVTCLICEAELARNNQRPSHERVTAHMATHGVDYSTCFPDQSSYVYEDELEEDGSHCVTTSMVHAEEMGRGRHVVLGIRVHGTLTE